MTETEADRKKGELEGRVTVLQILTFAILGMVGGFFLAVAALYISFGDVKTGIASQFGEVKTTIATQVGEIKTLIAVATNTIIPMNEKISPITADQKSSKDRLEILAVMIARLDEIQKRNLDTIVSGLYITDQEASSIRIHFNLPAKPNNKGRFAIGDQVPTNMLRPFPEALLAKLAFAFGRLKNMRYFIDEANDSIAITLNNSNYVIAVI
jgi:hypothetical protein